MKRLVFFLLLALALASPAGAAVFKIATIAPEGAFEVREMEAAADRIKAGTQGRVSFKFYTGGVMGSDQGVLRKIRIRQLQGGAVASGSLSAMYPESQIYSLPLIFHSLEEVDFVRKTLDPVLAKGYEEAGFVTFGIAEGGFARIMSIRPVSAVEDLRNMKTWIPENDRSALEAVKAFGISPVPLAIADVRTGLQTGMIDTIATPPAYAIILHWHTQLQYITRLPVIYTFGILAIDKTAFSALNQGDQALVREHMGKAFAKVDIRNREQNVEAMEVLTSSGIREVVPDDAAVAEWREKAAAAGRSLVDQGVMSREMVDTLNRLLDDFRSTRQ